jgi:long-subunit fatty acid transport protein
MFSKQTLFTFALLILCQILNHQTAFADEYHYQDLIVGERAAGLAGAYISIADDPSGLYHNPAGIIYNFENYFSLSANVYKTSSTTYKKAIAGQDYKMESSGWVPNFFGATQNYGKFKLGFAILSPSSEVLDLDDNISNISTSAGQTKSVRRRLVRQYSISLYGVGAAYEPVKDLAAGISLFMGQLTDKSVNTQQQIFNGTPERFAINESFSDQSTMFIYPKFGFQWMPAPKWAIGGVASSSYTAYSKKKERIAGSKLNNDGTLGGTTNETDQLNTAEVDSAPNALGPYELGLGTSYFPTKDLLFSLDVRYYSDDQTFTTFTTVPVVNVALGSEWYMSDQIVLRGGLYTNNANTPDLDSNKTDQRPHVDYLGLTAGITFANPGSSFTLCTQLSQGSGKGQILSGNPTQQDVESTTAALYITASYQL